MSYNRALAKPRTVRFSLEIDRKLSAVAARKGKTVSQVIRESVLHDLESGGQTAGSWILEIAGTTAPKHKLDQKFVRAYRKRHA